MARLKRTTAVLLLLCVGILGAASATAQIMVSNIDAAPGDGAWVGSDAWWAQGFITPSDANYNLTEVQLKLEYDLSNAGTFSVDLWSAAPNGKPNAMVAAIADNVPVSSLTTTYANYSFDLSSSYLLNKSTTYYLVVTASQSSGARSVVWGDTQVLDPGSTGPGQIGGWTQSNDSGASWDTVFNGNNFEIAVLGTPVPEPAAYGLIAGCSLAAFGFARRYFRWSTAC